ncbi:glutaredoxin [Aspergillus tanneri]|uniref:Glutaredoxin domain-containing protein n=1 Tax=Aspergillus tanneri TaxID=1220188 RepID=A0A5M9MYP8_9EURO|nr:uncharacterized protein ATNIH1004_001129 [Aspergillus tanneri]KAA8652225.1 hypothetical protein ATNIH1004_001129 [Aspergillus tanneri]
MFSQRRIRLLAIAVLTFVIMALYYSGDARGVQNQKFYQSTVAAIEAHRGAKNFGTTAEGSLRKEPLGPKPGNGDSMKPVTDEMKPAIPKDSNEVTEEIPIAGRTKMTVTRNRNDAEKQEQVPVVDEHAEAKAELNSILKRSPIIIFSKSYCPHSARAKSILLGKYSIVPAPYVVELDQHPLGKDVQTVLAENTGRRTVPNVLVSGKSIGGGDEVAALDEKDELASILKGMGGKWLQEVSHKETSH